jgi:integrase
MALTDLKIKGAKAKGKDYKLADGHGVYVLVTASGTKLWRWKYRFGGKEKLMALGAYPEVTLAAARDRFAQVRTILDAGVDPMADRKKSKEKAEGTFRAVALAWLEKWRADKDERYVVNAERRLTDDVLSRIGDRPIDEIQAAELVRMVCGIEERGASDVARRALQMTSQIFRYGIAHGLCSQNPGAMFSPSDVLKKVKTENFARVDRSELPDLMRKIEYYDGPPVTRLAMKLMALVFLRTSELIGGQWAEVDWKEARWNIPKDRMKGGKRSHIVPLSRQTIGILQELWQYRKNDIWMFPGDRANECMSNNTILKALERMPKS